MDCFDDAPACDPAERDRLSARPFPTLVKYMGSKAKLIGFVVDGIGRAYRGGVICDLFAGACTVPAAIGHRVPMVVNDIQSYSGVLAHAYLHRLSAPAQAVHAEEIVAAAGSCVAGLRAQLPNGLAYPAEPTLAAFRRVEERNRALIEQRLSGSHHLFTRWYAGTWWSAEQCLWIDGLRHAADSLLEARRIGTGDHAVLLACLLHAMAYCGQGTGHYAQYRDAKDEASLMDINRYRHRSVAELFSRKWEQITAWNLRSVSAGDHTVLTGDYRTCLQSLQGATVYADPPYAFVHYSRFYHAAETLVRYDYPALQQRAGRLVKGRYRQDRHQSPFSIRGEVPGAFEGLFQDVAAGGHDLVLSYSNTGLLSLDRMIELADAGLGPGYALSVLTTDHTHRTMGRRGDWSREVEEALLLAVRR